MVIVFVTVTVMVFVNVKVLVTVFLPSLLGGAGGRLPLQRYKE